MNKIIFDLFCFYYLTLFHIILVYYSSVGSRQRGVIPRARALQRRVPAGYIRERRHAQGVPHRGTHEVQERLQIQGEQTFFYEHILFFHRRRFAYTEELE